ncbi:glycosyltransferase family 4 protein [Candidatus Beckwithbacteria bacterium]|nr:glycosyltransferase family 4 protein [Candidatus Beckwithbacteria bacterium]
MIIGIDGNEANVQNRVGSNVYAYELLSALHELIRVDKTKQVRVYLKQDRQTTLPGILTNWDYKTFGPSLAWTQWRLPLELTLEKLSGKAPDIYFSPGHYSPRFSSVPTVVTIMDLAYLMFPDDFRGSDLRQLKAWTRRSVKKASHILAISQSTKDDIVKHYRINPEKITVTYPGLSLKVSKKPGDNSFKNLQAYLGITRPYLIYVGTLQPRKNISALLDSFTILKKQFPKLKLVIVGKKGWLYDEIFTKVKNLKLRSEVIFTGYVSNFEKYELLRHAQAFILPSLYEGFGLPVLEAMALDVPVIVSRVSSLPEVGGEAAFYIDDPKSAQNIAQVTSSVLQLSVNRLKEIQAKGRAQALKFTWQDCAQKTLTVLEHLARK